MQPFRARGGLEFQQGMFFARAGQTDNLSGDRVGNVDQFGATVHHGGEEGREEGVVGAAEDDAVDAFGKQWLQFVGDILT